MAPPPPPNVAALASLLLSEKMRQAQLGEIETRATAIAARAARCRTGAELAPVVEQLAQELARVARVESTHSAMLSTLARPTFGQRIVAAWRAFWRA